MISIGYTDKITKFRVHVLQLCLIIICLIISIARFASKARTTRSHTWFFAVVNDPLTLKGPCSSLSRTLHHLLHSGSRSANNSHQCLKSVLVITYQLLSEHHHKFQKWASLKANAILNCFEFVFWFAAFIMMCMGNSAGCSGGSCALSPILAVLGLILWFVPSRISA